MNQLTNSDLKMLYDYFKNKPVKKAFVFGSYARNEATSTSDLDLLVEFESGMNLFTLISLKQELEKLMNKSVDLISLNGLNKRISKYIDEDKKLIYEK
jgi:uncharacterized protein